MFDTMLGKINYYFYSIIFGFLALFNAGFLVSRAGDSIVAAQMRDAFGWLGFVLVVCFVMFFMTLYAAQKMGWQEKAGKIGGYLCALLSCGCLLITSATALLYL